MSNIILDSTSPPATKTDLTAAPAGLTNKYGTAVDLNFYRQLALDSQEAFNAGRHLHLADQSTPPVSASGRGKLVSQNGRPVWSGHGASYAGMLLGVDLRSMGAAGADATTDTAAINAAVSRAKLMGYQTIFCQEGQYLINGLGIDCTNITNGIAFLANPGVITQFKGTCTGRAMFDFTGSLFCRMENIWIEGNASTSPDAAILLARHANNATAGGHIFRNLIITGDYAKAAVASISSEANEWVNCNIVNFKAGKHGFSLTDQNPLGMTTAFDTFPATWSGGNTVTRFLGGRIGVGGNTDTEHCIRIAGARDVSFHGTFFDGPGDACIYVHGDSTGITWAGGSAESQDMARGTIVVAAGVTLDGLNVSGVSAYKPIYGETTSIVTNSIIQGQFYGNPDYGVDLDIVKGMTANLAQFEFRARSATSRDITLLGMATAAGASRVSIPAACKGVSYLTAAIGGDGRERNIQHINEGGTYSELSTNWLAANGIRTKVEMIAALDYPTGYHPDLIGKGAFKHITMDGDLYILDMDNANPLGFGGTKDEGFEMILHFIQDSTGGRNVRSWPSQVKGLENFKLRQGPGQRSSVTLVLGNDGNYYPKSAPYGIDTTKPLSVFDFGALGDSSTNDTTAAQRLADYAASTGAGATLAFGRGTFAISKLNLCNIGVAFDKTIVLQGAGVHATKLQQIGSTGGNFIEIAGSNRMVFRDMHIAVGAGAETALLACRTTVGVSCNGHHFENVTFSGQASKALVALLQAESCTFINCRILGEASERALFVGAKNGPSFTLAGATMKTDILSTIDNHFIACEIDNAADAKAIIHLHEGAGVHFGDCFVNYSGGSGACRAHVYMDTPTVLDFGWPAMFDGFNEFEGNGDVFLFGSGVDSGHNQVFRDFYAVGNWMTTGGYKWANVEGTHAVMTNFTLKDMRGAYPVKLGELERSVVHHCMPGATLETTGNINGCPDIILKDAASLTVGGSVFGPYPKFSDILLDSGGTGISRTVYGGGPSSGFFAGKSLHHPEIRAMAAAPDAGISEGLVCAADGTTWNPTGLNSASKHLVYFDGSAWRLASRRALVASATWDPSSIADGAVTSTTVAATGAALGDFARASFSLAVPAGVVLTADVTATDTVTVKLFNKSGGAVDLSSGTVKVLVEKD